MDKVWNFLHIFNEAEEIPHLKAYKVWNPITVTGLGCRRVKCACHGIKRSLLYQSHTNKELLFDYLNIKTVGR